MLSAKRFLTSTISMHNINRTQYTEYGIHNRSASIVLLFDNELAMIMLFSVHNLSSRENSSKMEVECHYNCWSYQVKNCVHQNLFINLYFIERCILYIYICISCILKRRLFVFFLLVYYIAQSHIFHSLYRHLFSVMNSQCVHIVFVYAIKHTCW